MKHKHKITRIENPAFNFEYRASHTAHQASSIQHPASSLQHPASSDQPLESKQQRPDTRNPKPKTEDHGFTLMEILLAFLILGIVVTTILASFNAVFSTTDTLNSSSRYYDMAKNCMNRITLDLEGLYITQPPLYKPPDFDDPPDPYRIVGSFNEIGGTSFAKIRFASNAHIPLNKSNKQGVAEIVYYVQSQNDGQQVLRRADHLYPYPPFEENRGDPVLSKHVKSLAFKYYDSEGSELEEWDSDSNEYGYATPAAIGIQLEIGDESDSYNFETTVRLAVHREEIEQ
ncbi:MAG: prepilin-type N-terminal cleavage/methylation domain-containing protein [Desulfobacterales bacterium]|jgi:general secretion pathway protein J